MPAPRCGGETRGVTHVRVFMSRGGAASKRTGGAVWRMRVSRAVAEFDQAIERPVDIVERCRAEAIRQQAVLLVDARADFRYQFPALRRQADQQPALILRGARCLLYTSDAADEMD